MGRRRHRRGVQGRRGDAYSDQGKTKFHERCLPARIRRATISGGSLGIRAYSAGVTFVCPMGVAARPRSSRAAWRNTRNALDRASVAMITPTARSGQPVAVAKTPAPAAMTAMLPIASLRVHRPHRTHVGVAVAEALEQEGARQVRHQGEDADAAHDPGRRQGRIDHMKDACSQHPQSERAHRRALEERCAGPASAATCREP